MNGKVRLQSRNLRSSVDPRNMRGLPYVLGVKGVQSNPDEVDLATTQPVIDMNMEGFARLNDYDRLLSCQSVALLTPLVGLQTKTVRILSVQNAVGADAQILVPVGYNFLVWGAKAYYILNAAGAAALAGEYVSLEIEMITPLNVNITKYHGTGHVSASCEQYHPGHYEYSPLTRENLCVVPAGCALTLTVWIQDGALTFPAASYLRWAMVGQAMPEGAPMPVAV